MSSEIIVEPFDACSFPPILTGTGRLFIVEGNTLTDCGNFSLVDIVAESEAKRYFSGSSQVASVLAVTAVIRLQLTGDSFSPENVGRLFNEQLTSAAEGDQLSLRTVRGIPTYQLKFRKDYPIDADCLEECLIDLDLWRCYLDPSFTYTFSQDEPTVHVFNFLAVPDGIAHPNNPFGLVTFTCPEGGAFTGGEEPSEEI